MRTQACETIRKMIKERDIRMNELQSSYPLSQEEIDCLSPRGLITYDLKRQELEKLKEEWSALNWALEAE